MPAMYWDLFCRVIDNHGDVGVCWRLADDLASRGERVRLWLDDASALAWMAPLGASGVELQPWPDEVTEPAPGDVVVEAFGCNPPDGFVRAMARQHPAPVWINLEYLSAEPYVERCHGLPSPVQAGPGAGLSKWFYYPGFTPASGGLIREPGLAQAQAGFDASAWLATQGVVRRQGERVVSLFCYNNPALNLLPAALAGQPTLLLLTPGAATHALGAMALPPGISTHTLPWLTQADYDRLLWSCDLNFVRGEDSFVRAQWAAKPFIWQIYPQDDGAHAAKLSAFLARFGAVPGLADLWLAWNGMGSASLVLPRSAPWEAACLAWRAALWQQPDLTGQLIGFAKAKAGPGC